MSGVTGFNRNPERTFVRITEDFADSLGVDGRELRSPRGRHRYLVETPVTSYGSEVWVEDNDPEGQSLS